MVAMAMVATAMVATRVATLVETAVETAVARRWRWRRWRYASAAFIGGEAPASGTVRTVRPCGRGGGRRGWARQRAWGTFEFSSETMARKSLAYPEGIMGPSETWEGVNPPSPLHQLARTLQANGQNRALATLGFDNARAAHKKV